MLSKRQSGATFETHEWTRTHNPTRTSEPFASTLRLCVCVCVCRLDEDALCVTQTHGSRGSPPHKQLLQIVDSRKTTRGLHWSSARIICLPNEKIILLIGDHIDSTPHSFCCYPSHFGAPKMAKRKSKRAPVTRKATEPLDTMFNCPFCNHEKSCEVKMDRTKNIARIACRICNEEFTTTVNYLSEPIDVYSDWIDACEQANS
jgi:transcription elongation factor Elf1